MSVCRHGPECPYTAEARRTFDVWMDAEKRFVRGELSHRQLHEAKSAYQAARDERVRECDGMEVPCRTS
jgi:hypothetical protein